MTKTITIELVKQHADVYGVSMPVAKKMLEIENLLVEVDHATDINGLKSSIRFLLSNYYGDISNP